VDGPVGRTCFGPIEAQLAKIAGRACPNVESILVADRDSGAVSGLSGRTRPSRPPARPADPVAARRPVARPVAADRRRGVGVGASVPARRLPPAVGAQGAQRHRL